MRGRLMHPRVVAALCLVIIAQAGLCLALWSRTEVEGCCTVVFYMDGEPVSWQKADLGGTVPMTPQGVVWLDEDGALADPAATVVTGRQNYYVQERPFLAAGHRLALDTDGTLARPDEAMTRAQAAELLYGLMDDAVTVPEIEEEPFADIAPERPWAEAVRTLGALHVLRGYADGAFRPDETVTRAEFTVMLCRMMGAAALESGASFPDVPADHWAAEAIALAADRGWVTGYEDGNFYPDAPITRAEAVVMADRARGRQVPAGAIDFACAQSPYQDLREDHWAYYELVDASYRNEFLDYVNGEAEDARPGMTLLWEELVHVNGQTGALDHYEQGFHTIDGALYYAPAAGYFLERFEPGLVELEGDMYYVPEADGPFLTDGSYGYLTFGPDGRYTSGSELIDAYVDELTEDLTADGVLTDRDRLYQAYLRIRDGDYGFLSREIWDRGDTDWYQEAAETFFQEGNGNCFHWAAGFMYVARRLGFQAYAVAGGAGRDDELHSWEMVEYEGREYICDVELEWAYRNGYVSGESLNVDLFMTTPSDSYTTYWFP